MISRSHPQQRGRFAGTDTVKAVLAMVLQISRGTPCTAHPRLPPRGGASGEVV
jgi:hypothetical protein